MKKYTTLNIALLFAMLAGIKNANAQLPPSDTAYQLVWADSFNTAGVMIDTNKWRQKPGWNQSDNVVWNYFTGTYVDRAYNKWYLGNAPTPPSTPADYPRDTFNCKKSSGNLNLYTRKENYTGNCWSWPSCTPISNCNWTGQCDDTVNNQCGHLENKQFKYTSGEIISKYKFRYGYFEMKFKLPSSSTRYDCGPAFWLWDADCSTIPWSEIDIMELRGSDNLYTNNLHYTHSPTPCSSSPAYSQYLPHTTISTGTWHTASCLWTSDEVTFYLDGQQISTLTNKNIRPDSLLPMPVMIDIQSPNANFGISFNAANTNDYLFEIDYIKVWQLKQGCSKTNKTFCGNFDPDNYGRIYKSVTLDGSSCVDAVTNKNYTDVLSTNYVSIDQGFSIDNNSTVLIDSQGCSSTITFTGGGGIAPPPNARIPSSGNPFPNQ